MKSARRNRHTLGLAMIMKDEIEDLERIINDYGHYFDKLYITVTHKETYDQLSKKYSASNSLVELSYFKWIDHFGKARRYNQQQIKTDYWMWIDMDDEIEGSENIPQILEHMITNDLDVIWFAYDYIQRDSSSDPQAISRRERIIRTSSKLTWVDEAIHEHIDIRDDIKQEFLSQIIIKHRKTTEQSRDSGERNRLILEKQWQQNHRPITAYYLGTYFGELGDYVLAIEKLSFAAKHSNSAMIRFAAWLNLCICYMQTGQYDTALTAADQCIAIDPNHPEPWYHKFAAYRALGDHSRAMQAAETSLSKPMPQGLTTLMNQDFAWYQYKGPLNIAHAYLTLSNYERAYQLYREVKEIAPKYIDEVSVATGIDLSAAFEQAPPKNW